jgi:putative transposase
MDYRRNYVPGGTYFFTLVTFQRSLLFKNVTAYDLFKQVVAEVKTERPFDIVAAVVLYDHLHMIWTLPDNDADYSSRWSKIKGQFTRRWLESGGAKCEVSVGKQRDARRGIWQPKFSEHTMRDEADLINHIEYIHYNPVRHGYVPCPKDWRWSSFHAFVKRGDYDENWCCGSSPPRRVEQLHYKGIE